MKKNKIAEVLVKKWYVPLLVVGVSVATAVTATANRNNQKEISALELWEKGDANHPVHQPRQAGGEKVLDAELFKPSLEEFIAKKMSNNTTPSGLIYDKSDGSEPAPSRISRELAEFEKMTEQQYFFKYAQHAKLIGDHADAMRKGTSGKGDIWVSSRIDKIYPVQKTQNTETQCADIVFRLTHFDVPRKPFLGAADESVTFWQEFKRQICQSKEA